MRSSALPLLVSLVSACSSAGGAPQEAVSFAPGLYILEATVTNPGVVNKVNQYHAELAIASDGAMKLSSSSGAACQDLSDPSRNEKRFQCGEESYRLRAAAGTVTGDIQVPILVETVVTECVPESPLDSRCQRRDDKAVQTTKQIRAPLRVRVDR